MSGGYFNYQQYRLDDIATMIEELIEVNDDTTVDKYGCTRGHGYSAKTLERFRKTAQILRIASIMVNRIDWLVSGDDGEESFYHKWDKKVPKIEILKLD